MHAAMEGFGIQSSLNVLNDFSLRTQPTVIKVMFENDLFKAAADRLVIALELLFSFKQRRKEIISNITNM